MDVSQWRVDAKSFRDDSNHGKAGHQRQRIAKVWRVYTLKVIASDAPDDVKWKATALSKVWISGGSFISNEILGNVLGTKAGYRVKQIGNISASDVAAVSGKRINFKDKAGNFTADLVLGHLTRSDLVLSGGDF